MAKNILAFEEYVTSAVGGGVSESKSYSDSLIATEVSNRNTAINNSINSAIGRLAGSNGRNLLANTDDYTYIYGIAPSGSYIDTFHQKPITAPTGTEYVLSFDAMANTDGLEISCFFYNPTGNNNTNYGINSQGYASDYEDGRSKFIISSNWKRYWVKWTQTPSVYDYTKHVLVGRNTSTTNGLYLRSIKFEEGNIPTPWSPAPEDSHIDHRNLINLNSLSWYDPYHDLTINSNKDGVVCTLTNDGRYLAIATYLKLPENNRYTISGYLTVNGNIPSSSIFTSKANTYEGDYCKHTYNPNTGFFVLSQRFDGVSNFILHSPLQNVNSGDVISISKWKAEKGSIATEWVPYDDKISKTSFNLSGTTLNITL